jgi:hypothetical protein
MSDDDLDALIRRAAAFPIDEAHLTQRTLAALRNADDGSLFALFTQPRLRFVPAAFAALLVATPFAITQVPATNDEVLVVTLALGDPMSFGRSTTMLMMGP